MNKAANVRITNELKNPNTIGMHYRILCMTGPNKGKVYYLIGKRVIIGRGETADIQIVDVKISREHAELSFSDNGYTITDLGAQNGIVVNDAKVKQKKLEDNEKIVIGQTVFKYNIFDISNSLVEVPESAIDTKNNKVKSRPRFNTALNDDYNDNKKNDSKEEKGGSKIIIMGAIVCLVLYVVMAPTEAEKTKRPKQPKSPADFENLDNIVKKSNQDDSDSKKKLEGYLHSGRREFSEGNYFRAIEDFRLALLINPNDGHASFYLSKSKQRLDEDIEKNFIKGKQEYESKKLQAAIVSYCSVVQLIQNYPNDERYKNAMQKISAIESELGQEKGEIKCFEEKSTESKN
jgi:pSer/pThr/pTyr-binding forkhead associated (FHA) protein